MFPSRLSLLRRATVPAAAVALLLSTASAQSSLVRNEREPRGRWFSAAAYDLARRTTVLFGGWQQHVSPPQQLLNDTHEWDGQRWVTLLPAQSPPVSQYHGMVHDVARGRTVAFGGDLANVWEWDGVAWHSRQTVPAPQSLPYPAMAYDLLRARTVLYTGRSGRNETWEWDGAVWTLRSPANVPGQIGFGKMAYDVAGQRSLLACEVAGFFETWAWDGRDWTLLSRLSSPRPGARDRFEIVYDVARRRLVLFGGNGVCADCDETWEWDGTTWTRRNPALRPTGRNGHAMVYDAARQRTVLFGGGYGGVSIGETWEWNGTNWLPMTPPSRFGQTMSYDGARAEIVLFGGRGLPGSDGVPRDLADTWVWDGFRWRLATPAVSPTPRYLHVMAFDERRNRIVLFGGTSGSSALNDTWEWGGTNWARATTPVAPPVSSQNAMTYDGSLQRVLLVSGGATWTWDGAAWTRLTPGTPPTGVPYDMAYDAARQRAVLVSSSGTWEWDGSNWTLATASAPVLLLTYDPVRQRVLGSGSALLEWTGSAWNVTTMGFEVDAMAFDAARGRLVSMTRRGVAVTGISASAADFGSGCGGTNGPPLLGSPEAFVGNESFTFDVANAGPFAPCVLGIAANSASVSLPGNCTFYLSQPLLLPTVTSGVGAARVAVPIPPTLALRGAQLFAQAFVADTGGALQIAFSAGRRMTIGD